MATLILAALVAVAGCTQDKEQAAPEKKPVVKLYTVASRQVVQRYECTGTVESFKKNHISPAMQVRIEQILVEVGDRVTQGQTLVRMENSQFTQQQAQLDNLRKDYERTLNLFQAGGISRQEVDRVRTNLDVMEASFANLRNNIALKSPINGVITARNYDAGDMYSGTPVLTVEQIQPLKTLIHVTEEFFPRVTRNMPVEVRLDIYPGEVFEGRVHLVYPTIDAASRTFGVEVSIPNAGMKIRPGMFARVSLLFGQAERVLVPDVAVVKQSGTGDRYVYVYKDGKVSYRKFALGPRHEEGYEVISGVLASEQVVVSGHSRLVDGAEAEVIK